MFSAHACSILVLIGDECVSSWLISIFFVFTFSTNYIILSHLKAAFSGLRLLGRETKETIQSWSKLAVGLYLQPCFNYATIN